MSATAVATRELLLVEAINDALHVELARDETVMVLGEDVGRLGGVFRATAGLRDRFGPDRCVDTPLSEAGILGASVGLCMAGWRPSSRCSTTRSPTLPRPADHARRPVSLAHGGPHGLPARDPHALRRRRPRPELHDDSPETYYVHTPGVKVAVPSTPADAKASSRRRSATRIPSSSSSRSSCTAPRVVPCRRASMSSSWGARGCRAPGPT